jgi:hypothetical protein
VHADQRIAPLVLGVQHITIVVESRTSVHKVDEGARGMGAGKVYGAATLGEICAVLEKRFGTYEPPDAEGEHALRRARRDVRALTSRPAAARTSTISRRAKAPHP